MIVAASFYSHKEHPPIEIDPEPRLGVDRDRAFVIGPIEWFAHIAGIVLVSGGPTRSRWFSDQAQATTITFAWSCAERNRVPRCRWTR